MNPGMGCSQWTLVMPAPLLPSALQGETFLRTFPFSVRFSESVGGNPHAVWASAGDPIVSIFCDKRKVRGEVRII